MRNSIENKKQYQQNICYGPRHIVFYFIFEFFKAAFDALDGFYRPDRPRGVGAVLNKSLNKSFTSNNSFRANSHNLKLLKIQHHTIFGDDFSTNPN